jgi:hypothetical protein
VPMSNPTSGADKADSAGRFPQIYASEGQTFDMIEKDASGVQIAAYLSVVSLGADGSGVITRDFGSGGRMVISGAGGVVSFEGGPPTGDDVGGAVRLGGYHGTQADTASIDAAATTVTGTLATAGAMTEAGHPVNVTLDSGAVSGSSLIVALPAGYRGYTLEITEWSASTTTAASMVWSVDGGSTYLGSGYSYSTFDTVLIAYTPAATGAAVPVTYGNLTTSPVFAAEIKIDTPLSGTGFSKARIRMDLDNAMYFISGKVNSALARVTHIKLVPVSGTFTGGRYRLLSRKD